MNARTDRWESYTDKAGRRHWRWSAPSAPPMQDGRDVDPDFPPYAGGSPQRHEQQAEADETE
jgi:hypothetical protein